MRLLIVRSVIVIFCELVSLSAVSAENPSGKMLKPCVVITGADSHVAKPRYIRVASTDDWARVWQEHKGQKPLGEYDRYYDPLTLPLIDFDRYMVIGIFQGSGWNGAGLNVFSIYEADNRIVFRYECRFYQTIGPVDGGRQKVSVYGFFVLPRSTKLIVLEENVQRYKGDPPKWKKRVTFSELDKASG